jgi:hypothetical protein
MVRGGRGRDPAGACPVVKVVLWALLGLVVGAVACGLACYVGLTLAPPSDIVGKAGYLALSLYGVAGGALLGLVAGALYGAYRARRGPRT